MQPSISAHCFSVIRLRLGDVHTGLTTLLALFIDSSLIALTLVIMLLHCQVGPQSGNGTHCSSLEGENHVALAALHLPLKALIRPVVW
jgi:hypothetical protein